MSARVYIAGPYTQPDPCENTHRACMAWDRLLDLGYVPFCPFWGHFQHTLKPRPYEDWIAYGLEWVAACDVVLRLPGESPGADREVAFARKCGIPVVHSIESLEDWRLSTRP